MALYTQLTDVEKTCLGTCEARFRSRARFPDELRSLDSTYDDQALTLLLTPAERSQIHDRVLNGQKATISYWVGVRTVELDRIVLECRGCAQFVLVGAGMDMRPWRLSWPEGSTVFELDSASICRAREAVAGHIGAPRACARKCVPADLADWEAASRSLVAAGFDSSRPAVFIAEGLLGYLDVEAMLALLRGARSTAAKGSVFVATAPPSEEQKHSNEAVGGKMFHKTFEPSESTARRMREAGWETVDIVPGAETASRYGIATSFVQDILVAKIPL
eukprot:m51a1_g11858 hypothetical protein (276) ;mRNA; r:502574-503532